MREYIVLAMCLIVFICIIIKLKKEWKRLNQKTIEYKGDEE